MSSLAELNKQIPKGIKAVSVNNTIHYVVRTSIKGKKYSLGTFLSLDVAIKALVQFKVTKTYTIAANEIADIVSSTVAEQQVEKENKITEALKQTPLSESVDMLREHIDMYGSHLLGGGNEAINISMEDGTIKHIPKEAVAILYTEIWGMPPSGQISQIVEL